MSEDIFTVPEDWSAYWDAARRPNLRDWFAGQALAGCMADGMEDLTIEQITDHCYKVADAMLRAREAK